MRYRSINHDDDRDESRFGVDVRRPPADLGGSMREHVASPFRIRRLRRMEK